MARIFALTWNDVLTLDTARSFHFLSGLPRSGSTLTAGILRQNPQFHAGMSSPVASLFDSLIAQVSAGSELSSMVDETQRKRLLRGLFESYYSDVPEPVIFDTNRAWTAQLPALMQLFPEAKVICLVRSLSIASAEPNTPLPVYGRPIRSSKP